MRGTRASEMDLIRRCRGGSAEAWREFVRRYSPLVYRVSYRMLRSREEAEDASQEAFLRVYKSFDSFDPTRPPEPWLSRIAYNVCLKRIAKSKTDPASPMERMEERLVDRQSVSPERRAGDREAGDALEAAMDQLSAQDRTILSLRYKEGLAVAEVAEATGIPAATVKVRVFRARAKLRSLLGDVFEEVAG
jgi:RNA polymerase sigma-70 factor (ECF subfamily)